MFLIIIILLIILYNIMLILFFIFYDFRELNDSKITSVIQVYGQNVIVNCESVQHTFTYDHCFMSHVDISQPDCANQEIVFKNMVLPLVQNAFEGYNVCLFAYGQTGSGKSYSMMGQESIQINASSFDEAIGIIPRFCQEIFARISNNMNIKTTIEISYFEIYNEKIHDLLTNVNNGVKRAPLKVREHPVFGPYIVDLSQHCVQNYKDLQVYFYNILYINIYTINMFIYKYIYFRLG